MNSYKICDCVTGMKELNDNSIDLIVTDPPYGYSFMGLNWDKALPSLEALQECHRVLKHGAFGFFMCAPRMDVLWRMGQKLELAGFKIDFSFINWAYSSGFPKSAAIDKLIDKREGAEREVVGISKAGSKERNGYVGDMAVMPFKTKTIELNVTKPSTEKAKEFEGSFAGFQPKPATEVIITVMKPLSEKSYVDQALENGKGVTWLGNCKIPFNNNDDIYAKNPHTKRENSRNYTEIYGEYEASEYSVPEGRFPANLLVSDNILDRGIITESNSSGKVDPLRFKKFKEQDGTERREFCTQEYNPINDSGDFSRYFSLDAWFDKMYLNLPEEQQKTFPYLITPKPSKSEKNEGLPDGVINNHPTVKPVKLFSYLITLGSRENDVVLDPFCGSGTIFPAAAMLNRNAIGFDNDPNNEEIIGYRGRFDNFEIKKVKEIGLDNFF